MASENVENIKRLVRVVVIVVVVLVGIVDEFSDYVVHLFTKLCRNQHVAGSPQSYTLLVFFDVLHYG